MELSYNIVVCVKQVPDTKQITGDAMKEDGTVNRAALPAIFNPEDLNALETALEIRENFSNGGGTVTVLTMGPPAACEVLRECYYRGADRCVLITDRRAAASDTLATSYILSCAARKLNPDLVLCGHQAIDGDTAQVGPQMAEKLGFTLITYLEKFISLEDRVIRARRNVGNGWEDVSAGLPVLMTVMETANVPRPYAYKKMATYKKARSQPELLGEAKNSGTDEGEVSAQSKALRDKNLLIESWDLDAIEADLQWCGMSGSPTKVNQIESVVLAGGKDHKSIEPTDEGLSLLVGELISEHTIG